MIASAVPLLLVVASIVALGVTGNLFVRSPLVIAAQIAAIGLSIWARRSFQKGTFRVTATPGGSATIRNGPYRIVRHPMYAAALLFIWAAVVSHVSVFTLTVGFIVSGIAIARVVVEERLLRARYADYPDYVRTTRALVPYVF
ncbi:MAG: isoprenylcysteine carboxylmethyltransferase family protein [Vicinamibacterales bacterium]